MAYELCNNVRSVLPNTLEITQESHRKFMSLDMQKFEKCDPKNLIYKIILIKSSTNIYNSLKKCKYQLFKIEK